MAEMGDIGRQGQCPRAHIVKPLGFLSAQRMFLDMHRSAMGRYGASWGHLPLFSKPSMIHALFF